MCCCTAGIASGRSSRVSRAPEVRPGMCYDSGFASASVTALMWHGWRAIGCVAITSEGESNTVEDVNVMS